MTVVQTGIQTLNQMEELRIRQEEEADIAAEGRDQDGKSLRRRQIKTLTNEDGIHDGFLCVEIFLIHCLCNRLAPRIRISRSIE